MPRGKKLEITPGKAGIGHKVKKNRKSPTAGVTGAKRKITDYMIDSSNSGSPAKRRAQSSGIKDVNDNAEGSRTLRRPLADLNGQDFDVPVVEAGDANDSGDSGTADEDELLEDLCGYEKIRLQNIKEKEAFLREMGISQAKADFATSVARPKQSTPSR